MGHGKPLPQGKVPFNGLFFCYTGTSKKERWSPLMSVQFRNVCGHIEVYDASGSFLFSADTMEEAWQELCA